MPERWQKFAQKVSPHPENGEDAKTGRKARRDATRKIGSRSPAGEHGQLKASPRKSALSALEAPHARPGPKRGRCNAFQNRGATGPNPAYWRPCSARTASGGATRSLVAELRRVARVAVASDTQEVLRLAALMYEAIGIDASGERWRQIAAEHMRERLGKDAIVFVIDDPSDEDRLAATGAGTIASRLPSPGNPTAKVGYVQWISTDPVWRRRGLARRIVLALVQWFRENEVLAVELHAAPQGQSLYRELGFDEGNNPALRLRLEPAEGQNAPPA